MNIVLASGSPRRQELLKQITDDFKVVVSDVEEITPEGLAPDDCPEYLALLKAREVARDFPEDLTIGCDTAVILEDQVLGKPSDRSDARRMLSLLEGKTHRVVTGCCLFHQGRFASFRVSTDVEFYPLSDEEIEEYLGTGEFFDKAGAYAIQGKGAVLVKGIRGDYFNVVGLPVARLSREIRAFLKKMREG